MRTGIRKDTEKYRAKIRLKELRLTLGLEPWQVAVVFKMPSVEIDHMEDLNRKRYPTYAMLTCLENMIKAKLP